MKHIITHLSKILSIFFLMLFISGCSLFSPNVTCTNKYLLTCVPNVPVRKTSSLSLLVEVPSARPVYNTTQMAYTVRPYVISYYGKNEWAETPAQMLHSL